MKWTIKYDNDVSDDDDAFWCWWEVSDGTKTFKCDDPQDAAWLCDVLNRQEPAADTADDETNGA
jgi:hypothetical protein